MKAFHAIAIIVSVTLVAGILHAQQSPQTKPAAAPAYEYKVMSLAEMFKGDDAAQKKIMEIVIHRETGFQRTDMDVPDYEKALNRIAKDNWELVTVNKANYWVFRRPTSSGQTIRSADEPR